MKADRVRPQKRFHGGLAERPKAPDCHSGAGVQALASSKLFKPNLWPLPDLTAANVFLVTNVQTWTNELSLLFSPFP